MNHKNEHFFFDGYSLKERTLASIDNMKLLINKINEKYFDNRGTIKIIPYFNGKVKIDGGVSGIIIGQNSHFTCHTFCYKETLFIDYFGLKNNHNKIKTDILKIYPTDDYDLCVNNKDLKGNFGKHIIISSTNSYTYNEAIDLIKKILIDIDMTPICDTISIKNSDTCFDLIQPIAESHISIHQTNDSTVIDAFSCKYFDEQKLLAILNSHEYLEVNRGIKYK